MAGVLSLGVDRDFLSIRASTMPVSSCCPGKIHFMRDMTEVCGQIPGNAKGFMGIAASALATGLPVSWLSAQQSPHRTANRKAGWPARFQAGWKFPAL